MKVLAMERQAGKTTRLVELALKTEAYLVVESMNEVLRIQREFKPTPKLATFREFLHHHYAPDVKNIIIDNVDLLLQMIGDVPVIATSLTSDDSGADNYIDNLIRENEK